jgi:hypothetical protein
LWQHLALEARPVPEPLAYLRTWVGHAEQIAIAGRLVE